MFKQIVSLIAVITLTTPAHAWIHASAAIGNRWGYNKTSVAAGGFIIDGCTGKGCGHGTWTDEYAVVGVIAEQIVEHGGLFCPYQIQCANKRGNRGSWTKYYHPITNEGWSAKCAWLCEPGYSGIGCEKENATPTYCDNVSRTDGKFSGISLKTSGNNDGDATASITKFHSTVVFNWGWQQKDYLLGVVKFLEHGVIVAPISVQCGADNWKSIDSFVSSIFRTGTETLLCATGFKANSDNTDCIAIDFDICGINSMKACANFDKTAYNSSQHFVQEGEGCVKFFCSDPNKAFPELGNFSCQECDTGVKGGPDPETGVCVKCNTGQYFDRKSGTCKQAAAISKQDMLYGKGKSKNSTNLAQQCWPLVSPEEYEKCVNNQQ